MSTDMVKAAADKLAKSAGRSSLDDFVNAKTRRSLLLVDCSSSMNGYIHTGETKIAALRNVVSDLRKTHAVPVAAFSGSNEVALVDSVPAARGMTPLHKAIQFGTEQGANHLIVVTDGQPDSEPLAFAAAREFGRPVDVFYIGDGNDRGAAFSRELAALTGGTANLASMDKPKELQSKIAGFLSDGTETL